MKAPWLRLVIPLALVTTWLVIAGIGGPYFGKISESATNNLTDFLPKDSESHRVQERLKDFTNRDSVPAILVIGRDAGLQPADFAYLKTLGFTGSTPVMVSDDKQAAQVIIPISRDVELKDVIAEYRQQLDDTAPDGLRHHIAGPAGFTADLSSAFGGIDGILLGVALVVVLVILLIVYRSPVLPFLVLTGAMIALAVSVMVVWWLANAGILRINGQVQGILFILVIGATTDYSLLYVARYREELQRHHDKLEAALTALKRSFEPIVASGSTVIVGLMCLLLSELDSNKALGPAGGIGIAASMLTTLTFLPAALYLIGRKAFWPFQPQYDPAAEQSTEFTGHTWWKRTADFVGRHHRAMWTVPLAGLVLAALAISQLKADGVEQSKIIFGYSDAREGQELISEHFPPGAGNPVLIIGSQSKQTELVAALEEMDVVESVMAASKASPAGIAPLGRAAAVAGPMPAAPPTVVDNAMLLQVTLNVAPDSQQAQNAIGEFRDKLHRIDAASMVGGATATQLDTNDASTRDNQLIIPVILAAIFLILIVLLRSLVAPVFLILSTAISFAASLGVAALLFNQVFQFPGADPVIPLYAFVFLVALGIDYNIFLMTRVREESLKHGTREGTIRALAVTGGVITSAGIVLAATFAALAVLPILFLAQLAFIVAFGVLLDTLIVRTLLVPGLMIELDRWAWWPSTLSKKAR
jgi:putative drug exporter of the RND superfamily